LKREDMDRRLNFGKILNYVRNLKAGNHGIFFYRRPHEKCQVLFNFLQAGIQKGEGAIYIASQETSKQIRRHMEDFGFNVKVLERDGVLRIFDYDNWYMIDGEVNVEHLIMLAQRVLHEAMEIGLKGLRGCGEAACFFDHNKEKELVEYELMIGRKFDLPLTALCAYDVNQIKSLEEKFFFSLIKAHGPVVTSSFARQVRFEDFFPIIMDEVLETVLGEIGKETILRILNERHSLQPHKIAEDPKSFIDKLEELIGSGAQVITKSVVREMHSKMGITQSKMSVGKR
jgi:hypothetical protein